MPYTPPLIQTSAQLAAQLSDETGTGVAVFGTSPTISGHPTVEGVTSTGATGTGKFVFDGSPALVTPALGTPASGTLTNCSGLPIANLASIGTNQSTRLQANAIWTEEAFFMLTGNGSNIGSGAADFFASGGNNAFTTNTNGIYWFEYVIWYTKNTAGTVTFTLLNSQTYTNSVGWYDISNAAGIAAGTIPGGGAVTNTTAAFALPATASLTTAVNHKARIFMLAEVGTAGNIRLQLTESAGTVTPLRGSCYRVWRAASASVGNFVA